MQMKYPHLAWLLSNDRTEGFILLKQEEYLFFQML